MLSISSSSNTFLISVKKAESSSAFRDGRGRKVEALCKIPLMFFFCGVGRRTSQLEGVI